MILSALFFIIDSSFTKLGERFSRYNFRSWFWLMHSEDREVIGSAEQRARRRMRVQDIELNDDDGSSEYR
jgi:hypothetical protein